MSNTDIPVENIGDQQLLPGQTSIYDFLNAEGATPCSD